MPAVTGSYSNITTINTSTTLNVSSQYIVLCNTSSANFNITLPSAAYCCGKRFIFKKIDTSINSVTIKPYDAQTIDGALNYSISTYLQAIEIVSDGTGWYII